ncbi:hypothetical protein H257_02609 [Aphanomyces astaci]|uniref:Uncharacterized protein n=1 Tax=Aphanomyces astaci TaxID=112090 RepID=W4H2Q7_APHAT|nr:hypothetical protein H257_02609 [Aphanomyces astaci]ETV86152.1 hypothetical protein H257_02609 [Aphanomyces astaci]|eukprot:XP_009824624.1 hypothetical protein H257_02609 [Aphanomyces astaci]
MRAIVAIVEVAVLLWATTAQHVGNLNRSVTEECQALKVQLDKLWIDQTQMTQGIVGGAVTETDCKQLHDINVMDYRTDAEQAALCSNACYNNTAYTYASMLNLDCFDGQDEYEVANQRLFAASFQFGCQQDASEKYCVPLLGLTIQNAGSNYDLCSDIVNKIGCCFESYKRYMSFGTSRSVDEMNAMASTCAAKVSNIGVPCTCHPGNGFASSVKGIVVCSHASKLGLEVTLMLVVVMFMTFMRV